MSDSEKKSDKPNQYPRKNNETEEKTEDDDDDDDAKRQKQEANNEQNEDNNDNLQQQNEDIEKQPTILGNTSSKTDLEPNVTNNPSKDSDGSSPEQKWFVMQGLRHSVSVKRPCHLPRKEGVNIKARRKLIIASIMCLCFMVGQVVGGVLSNSLAVAADAAHTLADFAGFMISLFAIWLAGRKSTDRLSFGWHRAEVIGALASIMTIWFITAILVWLAIQRCKKPNFEIDAVIMMIVSAISIVTNIILSIQLSYGSTSQIESNCDMTNANDPQQCNTSTHHIEHLHSHNIHSGLVSKIRKKLKKCCWSARRTSPVQNKEICPDGNCKTGSENLNVHAAYLHVIGDAIQSVGVLIAGFIIYMRPDWVLADPICTFIFAVIVLYTTIRIIKEILLVLMEGTPTFLDYSEVQATFEEIDGVVSVHNLRIWALSLEKVALAVHLVVDPMKDAHEILRQAELAIHTHYRLFETTIQIEEETARSTRYSRRASFFG